MAHASVHTEDCSAQSLATQMPATPAIDISQLYRAHYQHLQRFVQRYLRNAEDVEDVVQNTFCEAIRCADRFAGMSKPSTWLFGIALNLARNQVRRNCATQCDTIDDSLLEQISDFGADPAERVEQRQIVSMAAALLDQFPAAVRHTFEAVLEGDCTYEEAACQLNIPTGTVRSRVSRVRASIRASLE